MRQRSRKEKRERDISRGKGKIHLALLGPLPLTFDLLMMHIEYSEYQLMRQRCTSNAVDIVKLMRQRSREKKDIGIQVGKKGKLT